MLLELLPMTVTRLSAGQHLALELLASSCNGISEQTLARSLGFSRAVFASLVRRRLATGECEVMEADGKTVEVVRLRIATAGRRAIEQ